VLAGLPTEVTALHLSGLTRVEQVAEIARTRADAALVGQALMQLDDPRELLRSMVRAAGNPALVS
jgi:indole-3-glycerol phosphate synthase